MWDRRCYNSANYEVLCSGYRRLPFTRFANKKIVDLAIVLEPEVNNDSVGLREVK
jgi:hypothetical protein